jgi:hypothetical protein
MRPSHRTTHRPAHRSNLRRPLGTAPSLAAAAALVVLVSLLAGCTPGGAPAVSASRTSLERPDEIPPGELDGGGELDDLLPPGALPELPLPGDGAEFQECLEVATLYTEIIALTTSGDPDGELPARFDELAAAVPEDLRDDVATIRDVSLDVVANGVFDNAGALLGSEYLDAQGAILSWLSEQCGTAGDGAAGGAGGTSGGAEGS